MSPSGLFPQAAATIYSDIVSVKSGGTGTRFGSIVLILTGVAAISASFLTVMYVYHQALRDASLTRT